LRRTRAIRRSRHHTQKTADHGRISDTVSIRERLASVEDRAAPGHWEGDLLCGSGNSQIATLVERSTRYVMLVKVDRKDTQTVVDALIRTARRLPSELYKSLTWDRGKEMADHRRFTLATDIQVYFCDPQHPWQRGSNEDTNGLTSTFGQKQTFAKPSTHHLDRILVALNGRREAGWCHADAGWASFLRSEWANAARTLKRMPPINQPHGTGIGLSSGKIRRGLLFRKRMWIGWPAAKR
jgi:IS30 family transposase